MILISESLAAELHKIANLLHDLSTQKVPLNDIQKDTALVTSKWIKEAIPSCFISR